jgi:DNA polymerase-3 subunit delta
MVNEAILDNPAVDELIAAAETLPMFAPRRLVVVRGLRLLITDQQVAGAKEQTDALIDYISRVPSTVCLVFISDEKLDTRRRLVKELERAAAVVRFDPLSESALIGWIVKEVKQRGCKIDRQAAAFLIYWTGADLNTLFGEVEKLCAYRSDILAAGESNEIREEDIRSLSARTQESSVFEWTDALLAGRARESLLLLDTLLEHGESAIGLIALLSAQFRKISVARAMLDEKRSIDAIRQASGLHSFALDKLLMRARGLEARMIRQCINLLLESDEGIRAGRFSDVDAINRAMLNILALTRRVTA